MTQKIITSESVTEGHPDKICDYISDSILDYILSKDQNAQTAIECSIKNDVIFLFGEASTSTYIPYSNIIEKALKEIGYDEEFRIIPELSIQSPEINKAVTRGNATGAGDQGIMFGYACNDTPELMPAAIYYAHKLTKRLSDVRKDGNENILGPDGKAQVSVIYDEIGVVGIDTIVISTQHSENISQGKLKEFVIENVINPVIPEEMILPSTDILVNPSGSFVLGGPWADSGTTGRKIVVDSYGADCPVGGGCYSSKSPTKVDRAAAYYCRYVAKSVVGNGLADRCKVHVAYAIGKPDILALHIDTFGTGKFPDHHIEEIVENNFDFSVSNIIEELGLKRPIYRSTTNYGHFGKSYLPWEQIKLIETPKEEEI